MTCEFHWLCSTQVHANKRLAHRHTVALNVLFQAYY